MKQQTYKKPLMVNKLMAMFLSLSALVLLTGCGAVEQTARNLQSIDNMVPEASVSELDLDQAVQSTEEEMVELEKNMEPVRKLEASSAKVILDMDGIDDILDKVSGALGGFTEKSIKKMVTLFESLEKQKAHLVASLEGGGMTAGQVESVQASIAMLDEQLVRVATTLVRIETQLENLGNNTFGRILEKVTKFSKLLYSNPWFILVDILLGFKVSEFLEKFNLSRLLVGDALDLIPERVHNYI